MSQLKPNSEVIKSALKGPRCRYTIKGHDGLALHTRGDGNGSWLIRYRVADARLRLVLYHIPQVSGVALGEGVVATLLQHHGPHIVGIKDSGGQRDTSLGFARAFMPPLQVWVGHEPDLQELATMGARGVTFSRTMVR